MRIFHFLQLDWMITKVQMRALWVFGVLALLVSMFQEDVYWGVLYMVFGGMILSTTPFTMRQQSNNGFLLLLPASENERVAGRFAYGAALLLFSLLLGGIDMLFIVLVKHQQVFYAFPFYAVVIAVALIFISIQYTVLYIFGELKSQQVLAIIRMVPGFVFFFSSMALLDAVNEVKGTDRILTEWILWILEHINLCAGLMLLLGILIFLLGFLISVAVVKRKDFA